MRSWSARRSCARKNRAKRSRRCSAPDAMKQASLPLDADGPPRLRTWAPGALSLPAGWAPVVDGFFASPAGQSLDAFLRARLAAGAVIYPPRPLRALETTPLADVHAVILGQDPYHGPGQA